MLCLCLQKVYQQIGGSEGNRILRKSLNWLCGALPWEPPPQTPLLHCTPQGGAEREGTFRGFAVMTGGPVGAGPVKPGSGHVYLSF